MWIDRADDWRSRHGICKRDATDVSDGGQKDRRQDDDGAPRGETAVRVDPLLPSLPRLLTGFLTSTDASDYSRRLHKVKDVVTARRVPNSTMAKAIS